MTAKTPRTQRNARCPFTPCRSSKSATASTAEKSGGCADPRNPGTAMADGAGNVPPVAVGDEGRLSPGSSTGQPRRDRRLRQPRASTTERMARPTKSGRDVEPPGCSRNAGLRRVASMSSYRACAAPRLQPSYSLITEPAVDLAKQEAPALRREPGLPIRSELLTNMLR